jgi:CRISPR-associated exonuclease Cas4
MLILSIALIILAIYIFFLSGKQRESAGIPSGKIIYSDTSRWQPVRNPLYDPIAKVSGKPDYLVQNGKEIIPVEVKSGKTPSAPYDSHIYQLAAYCLLVEREHGVRPSYGIIHYPNRTFSVDYTEKLEEALLDVLTEMRKSERKKDVPRSHVQPARCRGCGYSYTCEYSIS